MSKTEERKKGSVTPFDVKLGKRIRYLRMERNISQEMLASKIGVTFQQIQKYENGANRIATSRLVDIARILKESPQKILEEEDIYNKSHEENVMTAQLISSWNKLTELQKKMLLQFIKSLSENNKR